MIALIGLIVYIYKSFKVDVGLVFCYTVASVGIGGCMTQTSDEQVEEMKALAEALHQNPMVACSWIDDWGRFGNFTLILTPTEWDRSSTNRLKGLVRRALKDSKAKLRQVFPPERTGKTWDGKTEYNVNFWKFDIDFQAYDLENNSFEGAES